MPEPGPLNPGYWRSDDLRGFGFASVGDNVQISKDCLVIGFPNISIGSNVRIDSAVSIVAAEGTLELGSYIHIGGGCHLAVADLLTMGDFSGLSQGVKIYTATDDYTGHALTNPTVPAKFTRVRRAPVRLGRHVIIGAGSAILPGVTIGEGSSVGALSLVTKSLDPWGVFTGNPAKFLKPRRKDLLELEAQLLRESRD